MITAVNYFDYAPKYLSKFNEAMKSGHEIMVDLKEAEIKMDDPNFIEGDIAEVVKMQVEQLNKLVANLETKQEKEPKTDKPKQTKTAKPKAPSVKKVAKVKPIKAKATKPAKPVVKKVTPKKKTNSKIKKPIGKSLQFTPKKLEATSKKLAKKIVKEEASKIPVKVNKLSLELSTIKAFVGLDGKTITSKGIDLKHKAIKSHFDKGHFSDHKSVLESILQKIGKAVEVSKSEGAENVKIKLEPDFKAKCLSLVKDAKPKIQVNYLGGVNKNEVIFINQIGKKYRVMDITNGLPWANETFGTKKEAVAFTKQNKLKILSPSIIKYSDGFEYKLLTYNEAQERLSKNKEVFGLDIDSENEVVINHPKDLKLFYFYGIELPKKN